MTTSYQHIIAKADAELLLIDKQLHEIHARLHAIASELETIEARSQARQLQLATAQQTAASARAELTKQQALAELAVGTDAYQDIAALLKSLEKQSKDAEKTRSHLEARADGEQAKDDERRHALQQEQTACHQSLTDLSVRRDAMERAKTQAFADLGEAEHRTISDEIKVADATIAELEKQVHTAQEAREALIKAGAERLERWPALASQVHALLPVPVRDAATRVLSAQLRYLDALLADGKALPDTINASGVTGNFFSLLAIPDDELWVYEHVRGNPTRLRARRTSIDAVLRSLAEHR